MSVRDEILIEFQERIMNVAGVDVVERNPKVPPEVDTFPCVSVFSGQDLVEELHKTGDYPIHTRHWDITVVAYIVGSDGIDDALAETEINPFVDLIKKEIYRGGANLGEKCAFLWEKETGQLLKPWPGQPGIGLPVTFTVKYIEDIEDLY
jgi:hypothetical protein